MKQLACIIAGLFFLGVCITMQAVGKSPPPEGWTTRCHIVRVIDGDTAEVEVRRKFIVRFEECWSLEKKLVLPKNPTPAQIKSAEELKKRGLAAKAHLQALAEGCDAIVSIAASEDGQLQDVLTLDRVMGELWLLRSDGKPDDESLSEMQVKAGHATKVKP